MVKNRSYKMNSTSSYISWKSISYCTQGSIIIIANLMSAISIIANKSLLKQHSNVFFTSLFISHVFIGLEELLDSFAINYNSKHILRIIDENVYTGLFFCQCLNLSVMTLDRLFAIKWPYLYVFLTDGNVLL